MGYVSCIINDIIPEEKVEYYIQNENLIIHLLKNELDVSTKEKLVHRLKETKFFNYCKEYKLHNRPIINMSIINIPKDDLKLYS